MIYIASPYSHRSADVREQRFLAAERYTAAQTLNGRCVFSPIVHGHAMAQRHALPQELDFWLRVDEQFIQASEGVIVLCLDGWKESHGVQHEIAYAKMIGKWVISEPGEYWQTPQPINILRNMSFG